MKKLLTLVIFIILTGILTAQESDPYKAKRDYMLHYIKKYATVGFEGKVIKGNNTVWDSHGSIYTSFTLEVTEVLFGDIKKGTVEIFIGGGEFERDGLLITRDYDKSFQCTGYSTFFCQPSSLQSGIPHTNTSSFKIIDNRCNTNLKAYPIGIETMEEFYMELNKVLPISIPQKKTPVTPEKKNNGSGQVLPRPKLNDVRYSQRLINYNTWLKKVETTTLANTKKKSSNRSTTNLILRLDNPQVTGSDPKYFEFDVMAKANTGGTYFDNVLMRIAYNIDAFGPDAVAYEGVTITPGTAFNSSTYTNPNDYVIDQESNTLGIPFGYDFGEEDPERTLLTTSFQQLIHVKMEIVTCGETTGIDFVDQGFTSIFSYFTATADASVFDSEPYDATYYENPLDTLLCQVVINDFNSPVRGGVGDTLAITGKNFGALRGSGQVKFKNADNGGNTWLQQLDSTDYISWADTLIKLVMPSRVNAITGTPPGSGNFILKNNNGDSVVSNLNAIGQSFKVDYSIRNEIVSGTKYKMNVMDRNNLGGYTIRVDTSLSNHADRMMCLTKAIQDWKCQTTINWVMGNDTSLNTANPDQINTIYFATGMVNPNFVAETYRHRAVCPSSPVITSIYDFDIAIKDTAVWWYDTTGAAIPSGKIDFYEVISHELGHALGLEHVNDEDELMYYQAQTFGNPRKAVQSSTDGIEGGIYQVESSIADINNQCGFQDMLPVNSGSCSTVSVDSLPANSSICIDANTTFSVSASGATAYQWQVSTNGGGSWANATGGVYSNATTAVLSLTSVPESHTNYKYRCLITATPNDTSRVATLTVSHAATSAGNAVPQDGGTTAVLYRTLTNHCVDTAIILYREQGKMIWSTKQVNPSSGFDTLYSLAPNTNYEWRVRLKLNGTNVHLSPMYSFTTLCSYTTTTPFNLNSYLTGASSAVVKWNTLSCFDEAHVIYRKQNFLVWTNLNLDPYAVDSAALSGLDPNTVYEWRVRLSYDDVEQNLSPLATFLTPCGVVTQKLINLDANAFVDSTGGISALLTWNKIDTCPADYVVVRYRLSGVQVWTTDTLLYTDSVTLSGLQQDTVYQWRISAKADSTLSGVSPLEEFTTPSLRTTGSISEETLQTIKVYPSPFQEYIIIENRNKNTTIQMKLYDTTGRIVKSEFIKEGIHKLDLNTSVSGLYFYKITDNQGRVTDSGKLLKY